MLRDAGIALTIKAYPYKGIFAFDGPIVGGRYDLALFANTLSYDPDQHQHADGCDQFAPKGENESRYCDPALDALERAGLATDDPLQRAAIYRAIGRRVHDERAVHPALPAAPAVGVQRRSARLRARAGRRAVVERVPMVDLMQVLPLRASGERA